VAQDIIQNDLPVYLFHQGTNYRAQDFFGCHLDTQNKRAVFRTWAPHAQEISIVGDFNDWDAQAHPMARLSEAGVWELSIPDVKLWQRYKFSIVGADGRRRLKSDPYAYHTETDGNTASIIYDIDGYEWQDSAWMKQRQHRNHTEHAMNIYEVHLGSWKRHADGNYMSYSQIADELVPYLTEMGYTHLELLPVMEHPFGRSWGYQVCGYYAATSRYGQPKELMALIDRCHQAGIGVILDWVPAHFPKDAHGLVEFDGAPLYEAQGPHRMEQREWGTRHFDYGRTEVQSFLISNALFWLERYHADGLRVDAVSSMLYHSYGRNPGEWVPNSYGGSENLDAVAFLQKLNKAVNDNCPGALMIAEEATAWPMMTKPSFEGGLGFSFKWNMGWMNDMLDYIIVDPIYRRMIHEKITFSFYYAFSENFILPISHDEVVYGKRSLLDKMPGDYFWKFAGARAFLGYMMAHPGKKLNFMGSEIGQFKEWDHEDAVEWFLLDYPAHQSFHTYVRELNHFYRENSALWEIDYSWEGFQWVSADDRDQNIVVFLRMDKKRNYLIIVQNFAPVTREGYSFGVPDKGVFEEVFNSDAEKYGGLGFSNPPVQSDEHSMHGFPYRLTVTVPPMSSLFLRLKPAARRSSATTVAGRVSHE